MKNYTTGFVFVLATLVSLPTQAPAVPVTTPEAPVVVKTETKRETSFKSLRKNIAKACRNAVKEGDITRLQSVRIRVACISPAFLERVEDLAVVQMSSSGVDEDHIPLDEEGKVIRTNIDWEGLIAFLEKLLPLILTLIEALG